MANEGDPFDWADDDYYPDDCCPPKEEPDCTSCNDASWYRPRGWRLLAAQFAPLIWGRGTAWNYRPRRGTWPCQSCNPCWIDWQLGRLSLWRWKLRNRIRPVGNFDDEPPF